MKNFLWWGLLIVQGVIMLVMVPPFQKFDEVYHFNKATDIAFGCLKGEAEVPLVYRKLMDKYKFEKVLFEQERFLKKELDLNERWGANYLDEKEEVGRCNSAIGHVPNGLGMWLLKWTEKPLLIFMGGRLMAFLFFVGVLWISLKKLDKKYHYLLWVFATIPVTVHQVTAYNYDAVILALMLPATVLLIKKLTSKSWGLKEDLVLAAIFIVVTVIKPTYIPLVLIYGLIDFPKYIKRNLIFIVILALALVVAFKFGDRLEGFNYSTFVNPRLQARLIMEDPKYFGWVLTNTWFVGWQQQWKEIVAVFSWKNVFSANDWVIYGYIGLFYWAIKKSGKLFANKLNGWKIAGAGVVLIGVVVAVCLSMYLTWAVVASPVTSGIQGRYWLPLVPFGLIFLGAGFVKLFKNGWVKLLLIVLVVSIGLFDIYQTFNHRFYDESSVVILPIMDTESDGEKKIEKEINIVKSVEGDHVAGFLMSLDSGDRPVLVPYKYEILDKECKRVIRSGYLSPWEIQGETVAKVKFKSIKVNNDSLCLNLRPQLVDMTDYDSYLSIKTLGDDLVFEWIGYED